MYVEKVLKNPDLLFFLIHKLHPWRLDKRDGNFLTQKEDIHWLLDKTTRWMGWVGG